MAGYTSSSMGGHGLSMLRGMVDGHVLHELEREGVIIEYDNIHRSYYLIARSHCGQQIRHEISECEIRGRHPDDLGHMLVHVARSLTNRLKDEAIVRGAEEARYQSQHIRMPRLDPSTFSHFATETAKKTKKVLNTAREILQDSVDSWLKGVELPKRDSVVIKADNKRVNYTIGGRQAGKTAFYREMLDSAAKKAFKEGQQCPLPGSVVLLS